MPNHVRCQAESTGLGKNYSSRGAKIPLANRKGKAYKESSGRQRRQAHCLERATTMTTTTLVGYVVRSTDAAIAFVANESAKVAGVKPLWIPRKKIALATELDTKTVRVKTGQDGERNGVPHSLAVDSAWLAKVAA